jgi:hypothetical protein
MKKTPWRPALGTLFAAALLAPAAHAEVIDFEPASLAGVYLPGESFSQGGFVLTALNDFGLVDTTAALGMQAPTGNSTQFYFASNDGYLRLSTSNGLGFDLNGFDTAFVPLDPPSLQPTVLRALGTRQDDSTVQTFFSFPGNGSTGYFFGMYGLGSPAGFTNLKHVEFQACSFVNGLFCNEPTANNGQFAIDNINVTVVPEPGAALLMALGLAGLALRQRRAA